MLRMGFVLALALAGLPEAVILPVHHRLPEELVKVIGPLLERDERAVAVPQGLWIQAEPARIEEIRRLVMQLDQRLRRLVISVLQTDRFTVEELNADVDASLRLPAERELSATARTYESRADRTAGTWQRLQTLEGQPAFIAVGQERPVPQINLFGPQAVGGIDYLPVTTGFQVTPRMVGCRVRLTISPWTRRVGRSGDGSFDVQTAATTLEAELGRWIELGAHALDEDIGTKPILGHRYQTSTRQLRLFLKVDALDGCEESGG